MRLWIIVAAAVLTLAAVGAWAYARTAQSGNCCSSGSMIVCPLTGEEIPPCCCPLKK